MDASKRAAAILLASITVSVFGPAATHAGLTDKLKKKVQDKAAQKVEQKADQKIDQETEGTEAASGEAPAGEAAAPGGSGRVSDVSTKFDYVPGDKVLLFDDFTQDELGEFPAQWKLVGGTFEVVEQSGERWLRCVSVDGTTRMKRATPPSLPEFWTLEFDFYATEPMGSALTVRGLGKNESPSWEATFPQGNDMAFRSGDIFATTPLEGGTVPGRHHVMFMARGATLKAYIDRQRMINVPDISGPAGVPTEIEIRLWASTHPMITNVRFAEGCRPAPDLLAEGKLVTYGIHFDSGSDVVKPESAPVLRQIAAWMEKNAAVKLRITGHTDNVGTPAGNLDLSKRRAAAVAKVLAEQMNVAADRFTADGKGDTEKVADNGTAAGRAMNRRVEFAKT
jgi:outer membrane protein OmpA-like peptidoglycan-associated protein